MDKIFENLTSFQQSICRTCLCRISASNSVNIFSNSRFYKDQTITQVFQDLTKIMINANEMLPINICRKCAEKLRQMVAFKRICEEADRTLRCKVRQVEIKYRMKKIDSVLSGLDAICNEIKQIPDILSNEKCDDVDPLYMSKILESYFEQDRTINTSLEPDNGAIIHDTTGSNIHDAIIIIQDTEKSDDCKISEVLEKPSIVVDVSDDEEQPCIIQKVNQNPQITNVKKKNCNTSLKKTCHVKENNKSSSVDERVAWIKEQTRLYELSKQVVPEFTCDQCDKKFTNSQYLERHLLYHSLDLIPTGETNKQNNNNTARPLAEVNRNGLQINKKTEVPNDKKFTNSQYLERHLLDHSLDLIPTGETNKQNNNNTARPLAEVNRNGLQINKKTEVPNDKKFTNSQYLDRHLLDYNSNIHDAIIIIQDTEKSDDCKISEVLEKPSIVMDVSDDEVCIIQKVYQNPRITNVKKKNCNTSLKKTCHVKENNKSSLDLIPTGETNKQNNNNTARPLAEVNRNGLQINKKTEVPNDKKFTNSQYLERHLLDHSLDLIPTGETNKQNNNNTARPLAEVNRNGLQINKKTEVPNDKKFTNSQYLERHLLDHSLDLIPTGETNKQNNNNTARPLAEVNRNGLQINKKTEVPNMQIITNIDHNYCRPVGSRKFYKEPDEVEEECAFCKKIMKLGVLHQHIRREHKLLYIKERQKFLKLYHKCQDCPLSCRNAPQMLNHMKLPHVPKFKCNHCDKNCSGKSSLIRHISQTYNVIKQIKTNKLCYICGKSVRMLNQHIQTHTLTKSIKCTFKDCNALFKYKSTLRDHIRNVHVHEKLFTCEHCGKQFSYKKKLNLHLLIHMDVLPHKCEICDKEFVLLCSLKKHLLSHTPMKPYTCPVCPQTFTLKHAIKIHCVRYHPEHELGQNKQINRNEDSSVTKIPAKQFQCSLCPRKFAREHNVKKHIRTCHPMVYFNQKRKQLNIRRNN